MKSVLIKQFKSLDGCVYETAKEARDADKEFNYERKQKLCKHSKTRICEESRSDCIGYEMYDRYTTLVKYCRLCEKDISETHEITESERNRFYSRQRYNEARAQYRSLKKRFN